MGIGEERGRLTFIGAIVQVDEVLFEFFGQGWGVDCIAVVLTRDVALTGRQVQGRDVVSTISVLELDGPGTGCKGKELMAKTDAHDRNLGGLHEAAQVVDCFLAMGWVTGPIGDEDSIKVMSHFVDREVIGEDGDTCSSADYASQDVFLHTAVDNGNMHISVPRADVEWGLGANSLDQVDLLRVNESLILICIIFLSDCNSSQ